MLLILLFEKLFYRTKNFFREFSFTYLIIIHVQVVRCGENCDKGREACCLTFPVHSISETKGKIRKNLLFIFLRGKFKKNSKCNAFFFLQPRQHILLSECYNYVSVGHLFPSGHCFSALHIVITESRNTLAICFREFFFLHPSEW